VPTKRYGTSAEIAATISFLASDGAAHITGQNIRVDGGVTGALMKHGARLQAVAK
jgi:NAD(P)-dependent dehydrogenase (short-subunit alcohol dehydrogenase family)